MPTSQEVDATRREPTFKESERLRKDKLESFSSQDNQSGRAKTIKEIFGKVRIKCDKIAKDNKGFGLRREWLRNLLVWLMVGRGVYKVENIRHNSGEIESYGFTNTSANRFLPEIPSNFDGLYQIHVNTRRSGEVMPAGHLNSAIDIAEVRKVTEFDRIELQLGVQTGYVSADIGNLGFQWMEAVIEPQGERFGYNIRADIKVVDNTGAVFTASRFMDVPLHGVRFPDGTTYGAQSKVYEIMVNTFKAVGSSTIASYQIRFTANSTYTGSGKIFLASIETFIPGIPPGTPPYVIHDRNLITGYTALELRAKLSGKLKNFNSSKIDVVATRLSDINHMRYNEGDRLFLSREELRNPVDVFRYILSKYRVTEETGLDDLKARFTREGTYFDYEVSTQETVLQILRKLAFACNCRVVKRNNKVGLRTNEIPILQTTAKVITSNRILKDSLIIIRKTNFIGKEKSIAGDYFDLEKGEVVTIARSIRNGVTRNSGSSDNKITLDGISHRAQALRVLNNNLRKQATQKAIYSFRLEIEGKLLEVNDVIHLYHSLARTSKDGYIISRDGNTFHSSIEVDATKIKLVNPITLIASAEQTINKLSDYSFRLPVTEHLEGFELDGVLYKGNLENIAFIIYNNEVKKALVISDIKQGRGYQIKCVEY